MMIAVLGKKLVFNTFRNCSRGRKKYIWVEMENILMKAVLFDI